MGDGEGTENGVERKTRKEKEEGVSCLEGHRDGQRLGQVCKVQLGAGLSIPERKRGGGWGEGRERLLLVVSPLSFTSRAAREMKQGL